MENNKIAKSTY